MSNEAVFVQIFSEEQEGGHIVTDFTPYPDCPQPNLCRGNDGCSGKCSQGREVQNSIQDKAGPDAALQCGEVLVGSTVAIAGNQ